MSFAKKIILLLGDIGTLYLSLLITLALRYGALFLSKHFESHVVPFSLIFIAWIFIFFLSDFYRIQFLKTQQVLLQKLSFIVLIALGTSTILFYLFSGFFELTPKTNLFLFGIIFFIFEYVWRISALYFFAAGASDVLIIGNSPSIQETVRYIQNHTHLGYRVAEWIENPTLITREKLDLIIREKRIVFIVIQSTLTHDFSTLHTLYKLLTHDITIINFQNFYELLFEKILLQDISEQWFIENVTSRRTTYDFTKRFADIFFSTLLTLIFFPLFLLIIILIYITSRGSIFYTQERVGKNGKCFTLYKLRTMRESPGGALWTEQNDSRITGIGKLLRTSHLDEIPQLWNIIRGDISFVGPRPERKELAEQYSTLSFYEMRHMIKPGLTGWAQINFRPSASLEEAFEKLRYDIFYVKNRSLILDIIIILKTIRYLFTSHR